MAIPTITSVTPARGHSGGGTVLRIVGTNFQLPPDPPASGSGPVPEALPTVRVFVGGVEARRVRVASATLLYVTTERRNPGTALDVEVRNVGPYGETLGAESVTLAASYEYARPVFTTRADLERLIRRLHELLVQQVFPEVVLTAHVDWNEDPSAVIRAAATAPLPCVFLAGPTLRPNPIYRTNVRPKPILEEGVVLDYRAPLTDDVVFVVGAQAGKFTTLLGLAAALRDFQIRNPFLYLSVEEGGTELVKYDLPWEGEISVDSAPNESNIFTCTATIVVSGFDTISAPGFENDQAITVHPELLEDPDITGESLD